jgi:hypothetical protein
MKGCITLIALVLALAIPAATSGATEGLSRVHCTDTIRNGRWAYGVQFSGVGDAHVRKACRLFAGSSFRLRWGLHIPRGWTLVASYTNWPLRLFATLIAPYSERRAVFRAVNRRVFLDNGWVLHIHFS